MASFNRIILIGNLTRDPDYKQLASGQAVCRLGLATNRQFKNRQTGTVTQEVCFVDIDVWGAQAESCRQYLQKGRSILVEGRLKFDSWQDPQGQTRSKHSIVADRVVFLTSNIQDENSSEQSSVKNNSSTSNDDDALHFDSNNPVEKDLLDQLEHAKTKVKAATTGVKKNKKNDAASDSVASEIDFKDTPPFTDDLPF